MQKDLKGLANIVVISLMLLNTHAFAYEKGDWIIKFGATNVSPDDSSDALELNGETLSLSGGTSELSVDDNTQLGLTLTYMMTNNWGLELLAATPFSHTASGEGELSGLDVADVKQLPPTLSAVYYFDGGENFMPYLGAGLNYTIFFDEDITGEADSALTDLGLTGADVSLDNSFGVSLQAGFDYTINENWLVNLSVRWIDIDTTATVDFDGGNEISTDVEIDPYVYSLFLGYTF